MLLLMPGWQQTKKLTFMKQVSFVFCTVLLLIGVVGCSNAQSDAKKQAELIKETIKNNSPGTIATSAKGYYMNAKIDGKDWVASHMMPDENTNSGYIRLFGERGADNISFQLWKRGLAVGKKIDFSENHAADLNLKDNPAFFGGRTGYVEITKMDEQWLEGTFQFTATSSSTDKKIQVTNGRFRVALVPGLK
jgi:hypothetical protein